MALPAVSLIVPVLNEAATLPAALPHLRRWQDQGCEVIIVDGGSTDATHRVLQGSGITRLTSSPGRARQQNAGAAAANGNLLVFLHVDTRLPDNAFEAMQTALERGHEWGRFDVDIHGRSIWLPLIAAMMNRRSRLTGIATGDQALFVSRRRFDEVKGFPEQPLMEDIELSRRLRRLAPPACLRERVITSGRRWDQRGALRTIWLMWRLRWRYWRGESPHALARHYR